VPCDGVPPDGVPCDGVPCDGVLCDGVPCASVMCDGVLCDGVLCDGVLCDVMVQTLVSFFFFNCHVDSLTLIRKARSFVRRTSKNSLIFSCIIYIYIYIYIYISYTEYHVNRTINVESSDAG